MPGNALTRAVGLLCAGAVLAACTTQQPPDAAPPGESATPTPGAGATPSPSPSPSSTAATPSESPSAPAPSTPTEPARFDTAAAMRDVQALAGRIGPRLATGPGYRRAAALVQRRFEALGYAVRREVFPVPAGDSWGVPVTAGRSSNVVAEPAGFDPAAPHVVVGAHLDTVAVAPGAEDNASGVAVLLELARLAALHGTRVPVVLVAFGAEEPRGPGDDLHHFGSQHHVRSLSTDRRRALIAMVSLDRVGVGPVVPVCTGPLSPPGVQRALVRAGRRVDVPTRTCENTASDHWSFEKAGVSVARLGSTSYAAYHSAADLPGVVDPAQLDRTGRVLWSWLARRGSADQ